MTQWPSTLPLPLRDFSGEPRNATIASSLESARIQRRTRFRSAVTQISVKWNLTLAEMDAFELFFDNDLENGAGQFEIELRYPLTTALEVWLVRFLEGYEAEHVDGTWSVSAVLELLRPPLTAIAPLEGWQPFWVQPNTDDRPFITSDGFSYNVKL